MAGAHARAPPTAEPFPQDDLDKIIHHIVWECGQRRAQGVRELAEQGKTSGLSRATLEAIQSDSTDKSFVNRRLDDAIKHDVALIAPYLLDQQAIDDATAAMIRDLSGLRSMTVVTADDFTFPVYFLVPDGRGWWKLTRGQCLLFIDVRSLKIIAYALLADRNYNSLAIRTCMNQVCREHGLPLVWHFEGGMWKNAKVVVGDAPAKWDDGLSWSETELGWEKLGVHFINSKRARSKYAEMVGGKLQNFMESVKGYCGRNERFDCPGETRRHKDDVEYRRVKDPTAFFFTFEQWDEELGKIIDRYNGDVHGHKNRTIIPGLNPDLAFEKFWVQEDVSRPNGDWWHLVAHYVRKCQVTKDGINFRIGREIYRYFGGISEMRLKTVLAWLDPQTPDWVWVTDLNRKQGRLVPRHRPVGYLAGLGINRDTEEARIYREEVAKAEEHNSYPRARYHVLKAKFERKFRANQVDPQTAGQGQAMADARAKSEAETRQADHQKKRIRLLAGAMGAPIPSRPRNLARVQQGLDLEQEARADIAKRTSQSSEPSTP
jgi:hypothetical protein